MGIVLADLRQPKPGRWMPPVAATPEQLRAVVDTLPAELPRAGNEYSAAVMADVLLAAGDVQRAGEFAATAFTDFRVSNLATTVARAAAAMGDSTNALRWLGAASTAAIEESDGHRRLLARTMDTAPEFASVRNDPSFSALRGELVDR